MVTATLAAGYGYSVGSPSSAAVTVTDDEASVALASLSLSGIDIAFDPAATFYAAAVGNGVGRTTVRATAKESDAVVAISPADADGAAAGHQVDLAVGMNEIAVTVTATDGRFARLPCGGDPRTTAAGGDANGVGPGGGRLAGGVRVTLDRASDAVLTVAVSVGGSDGVVAGTPPTSVGLAAGATRAGLAVATDDDAVVEADGTVTATLVAGQGYTLGAATSADVTVTDDDVAAWAVTAAPSLVEEGGTSTVTLAIDNGVTFAADRAVTFAVSGVGADQYRLAPETVMLSSGATSVTATFEALSDRSAEEPAAVKVTASVDGAAVGSTTVAVEDPAPRPTIAGVPQVGGVLAAEPAGADGYEWLRAGEPVAGAADVRYAPVEADVGLALSVRVDARGRWRTSAPTIPIWAAPVSPPLSAGEEELLGTTMTLGRGAAKVQLAGFLRRGDWEAWPEDFGSVDDAAFADGRHELRLFLVYGLGRFALATSPAIGMRRT